MGVVPFPGATGKSVRADDRETLMGLVQRDLWSWDLEMLANRIGVSKSALYAIRAGRTKWPRHGTLFALIHVLGYELWLVRA